MSDLPGGHHLLYVMSDNDLNTEFPTQIYAFEVDPSSSGTNIRRTRQTTPGPIFPSAQVQQILGAKN